MSTFLVDFVDNVTDQDIADYFANNNCVVKKHLSNLNKIYLVESDTQPPMTDITVWVVNDDDTPLQLLSQEVVITPSLENFDRGNVDLTDEKDWWKLYSLNKVDFSIQSMEIPVHKTDNVVFVLDSGIKIDHPEFAGRRIDLFHSFIENDFSDNNGHGTALASLINGNTCSMLDCDLKVVKIFDKNVQTKQSDILSALNAIANFVLNNPNKLVVLNMSWSIPKNEFIESKIQLLSYMGALIVASAGNAGMPISDVTPAGMNEVLTIGSYNSSFLPSDFSNYQGTSQTSLTQNATNHGELDGWAPGEQIYTASITSQQYGFAAGTSLSAAITSAGLLYNMVGTLDQINHYEFVKYLGYEANDITKLLALKRKDLLDLSNPKYEFCQNKVVTFTSLHSKVIFLPSDLTDKTTKILAVTNKPEARRVFIPNLFKSFEWLTPLPDWVEKHGEYLVFNIKTEPNNERDFYEVKIKLFGTGEYEGINVINTFELMHVPSNFDINSVAPDDMVVDYILQIGGEECNQTCINDCPNIQLCCGEINPKGGCFCEPGVQCPN